MIIGETVCENFSDKNALNEKSAWTNGVWFGPRPGKKRGFEGNFEENMFMNNEPIPYEDDGKRGIKFTPRLGRKLYESYPIQDELNEFMERTIPKRSKFTPRLGRELYF